MESLNGTYIKIKDYEILTESSEILIGDYCLKIAKRNQNNIIIDIFVLNDMNTPPIQQKIIKFARNQTHHKIGSCSLCSIVLKENKLIDDFHAMLKINFRKNNEIGIRDLKSRYG